MIHCGQAVSVLLLSHGRDHKIERFRRPDFSVSVFVWSETAAELLKSVVVCQFGIVTVNQSHKKAQWSVLFTTHVRWARLVDCSLL